ncbi:hypothetical protein M2135_000051 [Parabacteroides sp. PF5-9]|nr:hypothetical protein [Parabacteroides sp. PF5-9]
MNWREDAEQIATNKPFFARNVKNRTLFHVNWQKCVLVINVFLLIYVINIAFLIIK